MGTGVAEREAAELPVFEALPALVRALAAGRAAVLVAPPGAGKTTGVPPALLAAPWLAGRRIVMLEPRRLAARAAAARMAALRGEAVGATIGYRVSLDSRVGPHTRVEVVTEGVLTRRLQHDPSLADVGLLIFDEFHERSLQADLGLALALDAQAGLREDLRILVMSATLDGAAVAALLGHGPGAVPVIESRGRSFPVALRWAEAAISGRPGPAVEPEVAEAVRRALAEQPGDVLAFLPGEREIRRCQRLLADLPPGVAVHPLAGALSPAAQEAALRPAPPGGRKVVLATAVAQTSLTIEGVGAVIDSGLARVPRFDPRTGMSRLATERVSRATAEQRRGRAGRLGPGLCYRLWPAAAHGGLLPFDRPEILEADLAPLALALADWGAEPAALRWLDPPPAPALAQARDLLAALGALDAAGRVTGHGRAMAALPLHPRLAHMVLRAGERDIGEGSAGEVGLACLLAALLQERDPLRGGGSDLRSRLALVLEGAGGEAADRGALERVRQTAARLRRLVGPFRRPGGTGEAAQAPIDRAGALLALAYPDRIALRRPGSGSGAGGGNGAAGDRQAYLLSSGRGASLAAADPLAGEAMLVVADVDGAGRDARIYLAAPLSRAEFEEIHAAEIVEEEDVAWNAAAGAVTASRRRRFGALTLARAPLEGPDPKRVKTELLAGIRGAGLTVLPWTAAAAALRARVGFLAGLDAGDATGGEWPDWSDAALLAGLEAWLGPHLDGRSRLDALADLDLATILGASLSRPQRSRLEREAPARLRFANGAEAPVDYAANPPAAAIRLQALFGTGEHPTLAGGRVRVALHLLSPAGRPVQVTGDLPGFWAGSYAAIRAELRGRYPKHPWPEDPRNAAPPQRRPGAGSGAGGGEGGGAARARTRRRR